jgi:hypothetical protein
LTPAEETIIFIKESLAEIADLAFWEDLQICIDRELGRKTILKTLPLNEEKEREFGEEVLPSGKYVGRKVKEIYKKDKKHLMKHCYTSSLFQLRLRRYIMGKESREK